MLIEEAPIPADALPIARMKDHLRLSTGFGDDAMQDALVESYLRSAIAAIEGRIGKALIARRFRWEVRGWRNGALPIAPVSAVTVTDASGLVAPERYVLEPDAHRPRVLFHGQGPEGRIVVGIEAGFGGWDAVPADISQAVMLLAAEYYEHRHEAGQRQIGLPGMVVALIERWRTVRVLGGGAA